MKSLYQSKTKGKIVIAAILLVVVLAALSIWQIGTKQITKNSQNISPLGEGSSLQSEVYTIESGCISKILPETTLRDLKNNIDEEEVVVYKHDNTELQDTEYVGSGMKLIHNRQEYKLAVVGDLNGDGKLRITDLVQMRLTIVGLRDKLVGEYEKAGDLNYDGKVSITDLTKINLAVVNLVDIIAPNTFVPEIVTTKDTITVLGETTDAGSGIKEYYFELNNNGWVQNTDKTNNKYTYTGLEMETKYSIRMKVVDNAGNTKITKRVEVETLNEENANIGIVASTEEWTNQNILVAINFNSNVAKEKKEISVDGGTTWRPYTEPITVEKNMEIRARVVNAKGEVLEEKAKTITNIDKTLPEEFEIGVTTTGDSIVVTAETEDGVETTNYGKSGIKEYEYTIVNGIWQSVTRTTETTHTFSDLKLGTEYTITVKAIDNAGNERIAKNSDGTESGEKVIIGTEEDINNLIEEEGGIIITPATEDWTNQDITVEVIYPEIEGLIKEIKIGEAEWKTYSGSETVQTNTVVKARMSSRTGLLSAEEQKEITNIDKITPQEFVATVREVVVGAPHQPQEYSILVMAETEDGDATTEYGKSGIKEYEYTIINGRWKETHITADTTYTFDNLEPGLEYVIKVKAVDNAGNERIAKNSDGTEDGEKIIIGTIDDMIEKAGGIKIVPDTTEWTNQGVSVSVIFPTVPAELVGEISIDDGASWSEYPEVAIIPIETNTVIKARMKDEDGQTSTEKTLKIENIDKLAPKEFDVNVETTANTIKLIASTEDAEATTEYGKSGIAGYSFKINDEEWTEIIASGEHTFTGLTEGETYKIIVKAVDNAGNETIASNCKNGGMDVIPTEIPDYYGKEVTNYESSVEGVNWVVYHKDEDGRIYLTTDDYIPFEQIPETRGGHNLTKFNTDTSFVNAAHFDDNVLNDYTGSDWIIANTNEQAQKWLSKYLTAYPNNTNENIKAVAYMMDTDSWSGFAGDKAEYAIGGPTIELFCESYKATHPNKYIECDRLSPNGYKVKWNDSSSYTNEITTDYIKTDFNGIYTKVYKDNWAVSIWLASPSAAATNKTINIRNGGAIENYSYDTSTTGFRPIVCLKSGMELEKNEDGTYRIEDKRPEYTVTFNANGGTVTPETITSKQGEEITLPTPTRTEYTFEGWYSDSACTEANKVTETTYTVTEDITLYAKWISEVPDYYGKEVTNYTEGGVNWRVYHKDDNNVYLIADDYIPYANLPTSTNGTALSKGDTNYNAYLTNILDYTGGSWIRANTNEQAQKWLNKYLTAYPESTNNNIKAVAYMMDTESWSDFAGEKAEYAIGGPTIELFCASYKETHPSRYIECDSVNANGYNVKWSDGSYDSCITGLTEDEYNSIYIKSDTTKAYGMWIASPSANEGDPFDIMSCEVPRRCAQ